MGDPTLKFGLNLHLLPITPGSRCYRPPCWPPPNDWVVSLDGQGNPLSRWGDPLWDFSHWAGKPFKLDFAGGRYARSAPPLSPQNQYQMRMLATWIIWGPAGGSSTWWTLKHRFSRLRRILALCEGEGVLASELTRFPQVLQRVPRLYPNGPERGAIIVELDRILRAKDLLGFKLLDEAEIGRLAKAFDMDGRTVGARKANHSNDNVEQTAYIPPRIWTYQLLRLRECLDDFLRHRKQVEACFSFCVDAYARNFGTLADAFLANGNKGNFLPFTAQSHADSGIRTGRVFYGQFVLTARRFGVADLLERWVLPNNGKIDVKSLSAYLTLVQLAGLAYIANFTLQRREEAASLRADCLVWDSDPLLGRLPIICGETTKTDPDSDARWPTSPSAEVAVEAVAAVARLRSRCAVANPKVNCSEIDSANPYLLHYAFEPWSPGCNSWNSYSMRPHAPSYRALVQRFPRLFDLQQLRMTEADLAMARKFTPNLCKGGKFRVGKVWPLAYHQLRRTGAINMFASGLVSDSSIQVILKHLTLLQSLYYGRNSSRLRFSEDVEDLAVKARYEVLARQIESLEEDRYVSPLGRQHKQEIVVNLVGTRDFKALVKAGSKGEISFRETRLGGCTKRGHCDYGGIESVARCAGGDGEKPCRDAVFDRRKKPSVMLQLESGKERLKELQPNSPRLQSLGAELHGLRNYLNVIRD